MKIKCNNEGCCYQYGGDCTVMEHIKLFVHKENDAQYLTHCTAFCREYVHSKGEVESFSDRNVFCSRKDCKYNTDEIVGKCKRKSIKVITGLYGDSECRCTNFERKVDDE